MTRADLCRRQAMLHNRLQIGELSREEHDLLREGAVVAYGMDRPARRKARRAVQSALEAGLLVRPAYCTSCGSRGPVVAHHESYDQDRALVVRWLCLGDHARADREIAGLVPAGRYAAVHVRNSVLSEAGRECR